MSKWLDCLLAYVVTSIVNGSRSVLGKVISKLTIGFRYGGKVQPTAVTQCRGASGDGRVELLAKADIVFKASEPFNIVVGGVISGIVVVVGTLASLILGF